jgi:S1-C subfamily serine protease
MKEFVRTVLAVFLGVLLAGIILLPKIMSVNPYIATFEKDRVVRALMTPVTFILKEKTYAVTKQKEYECERSRSTAFTIKKAGYLLTNNHNVAISTETEKTCYEKIAKELNVSENLAKTMIIGLRAEYTLTNEQSRTFPVKVFHTFPKDDIAVLKIPEKETGIIKNWEYVPFRTEAIEIVDGKVIPSPNNLPPTILKDEPVVTMGEPIGFSFTLTEGKMGNSTFTDDEGVHYAHAVIPLNGGNSGGAVISLLDIHIIGMATIVVKDHGENSLQSGIIPFYEIEKALKSIGIE